MAAMDAMTLVARTTRSVCSSFVEERKPITDFIGISWAF